MDKSDGRIRRDEGGKWSDEAKVDSFNRILTRLWEAVMMFSCRRGFFSPGPSQTEALTQHIST